MKKVLLVTGFLYQFLFFGNYAHAETLTIYGSPNDGTILSQKVSSWSDAHDASAGEVIDINGAGIDAYTDLFDNKYNVTRSFFLFDTSALPDNAQISSVKFGVHATLTHNNDNDSSAYMGLYQGLQNPETILSLGDFDLCGDKISNPTSGAANIDLDAISAGSYFTFNFNSIGRTWISKDGYTPLCIREGHDAVNDPISFIDTYTYSGIRMKSANTPGTDKDPYLEITYTVPGENNFPLYTQITSPYPSIAQTASWADDVYASGKGALGSYPCGLTVAQCGCAISSLVMGARNAGITEDVLGDDVNPGSMNAYLDGAGGYDSEGSLYWLAAQVYFGKFTSEGKIASRFSTSVQRPIGGVTSFINSALTNDKNAVLGYKNGHFVWLPKKTTESYLVNDPWWFNTKTADDVAGDKVRDYNNTFDDARAFTIADEPVILSGGGFEAHVRGTAELLFKKATGEKVGYSQSGATVIDLANASYGSTNLVSLAGVSGSNGKTLVVQDSGNNFTLDVTGTGSGEYRVEFFAISEGGVITKFALSGQTIPGVTTSFVINLATGKATEQPISYAQFLDILNREMAGYTDQQKTFFLKWADKIYSNMENKTTSQAIKSIEVYQKLLIAKKVTSPVLSSVLDLLQQEVAKK